MASPHDRFLHLNARSRELWERSCRVIVGGGQGHKRPTNYLARGGPGFFARAQGARCWDADGRPYIDYLLGYGPIVLGHADPDVNAAVTRQLADGTVYSVEHPLEIDLAEELCRTIPCAEMVAFTIGGTSATTAAVRCARAHTGREAVIRCGYHGWTDWCVPTHPGVPLYERALINEIPYNDLPALRERLEQLRGRVACVIIESVQGDGPAPGYFDGVRALCDEHAAVFILDEVKTGFRFALGGAQELYGIRPDLATFGKAMCNGLPGSCVVGKRAILEKRTDTSLAATFHGELLSVVAALTTIRKLRELDGPGHFRRLGQRLLDGMNREFQRLRYPVRIEGHPAMPNPVERADAAAPLPAAWKGLAGREFCAAMQRRGFYVTMHVWFLSLAHGEAEIDATIAAVPDAVREATAVLEAATGTGQAGAMAKG